MQTNQDIQVVLGTGPLGQSVMRELVRRGAAVRMVNRTGRAAAGAPPEVEFAAADLYQADAVRQVTRDASIVYLCAQPAYTEWPEKFPPLIESILVGLANKARLVMGDNLYMYGPVDGPIHENLPYTDSGRKGPVRARVAERLLGAHRAGSAQVTIGRGSDFFGPGVVDSVVGSPVFGALSKGKTANVLGNIDLPHTYTFIDDFGRALVELGQHDQALGQIWHIPNAAPITTRQFVTLAAAALGTQPRVMAAGRLMMRAIGLFIPEVREMIELEYEVLKPYVVDDSKYKQAFGDHSTPLPDAIRQTAAWYQISNSATHTSRSPHRSFR